MDQKRGAWARIGVSLLNLLTPGVGLLRLGKWKIAAAMYSAVLLLLLFLNFAPPVPFALLAAIGVVGLGAYPVSIIVTWVLSRRIGSSRDWYSQWYIIVGAMLGAFIVSYFLGDKQAARYRSFYTPAEGMAPTLPQGDRLFAYMRTPKDMQRGDILLVRAADGSTYIKRLAALPGDVIAVVNGFVVLNGKPVAQQLRGSETVSDFTGRHQIRKLSERFPGESGSHEIYDQGDSIGDNAGPMRVRPGHIFLLGDNRDRSADSRFSHEEMGLEQIPMTDIQGWPLYHSFGSSRPMGELINRRDMQ